MSYEEDLAEYNRRTQKKKMSKGVCALYAVALMAFLAAGIYMLAGKLGKGSNSEPVASSGTEVAEESVDGTDNRTTEETEEILGTELAGQTGASEDEEGYGTGPIFHYEDKEGMAEMDAHTWLETMKSILSGALEAEQPWAAVLFDDGTGIFVPYADITIGATYVAMEEDGTVTDEYGEIVVNGENVTYMEYEVSNADTMEVLSLIGNEYYNDATYATVTELSDGQTCITVYVVTDQDDLEAAETIISRLQELDPYMVYVHVNSEVYIWKEETGTITDEEMNVMLESLLETEIDYDETELLSSEEVQEILEKYGLAD